MARVLREPEPLVLEVTCERCAALIAVEMQDIRYYGGQDYPIARPASYWFRCPHCDGQPDIPKDQVKRVSPHILRAAEQQWFNNRSR